MFKLQRHLFKIHLSFTHSSVVILPSKEQLFRTAFNSARIRSKWWTTGVVWTLTGGKGRKGTADLNLAQLSSCSKSSVIRWALAFTCNSWSFLFIPIFFSGKGCGSADVKVKVTETEFDGGCNVLLSMVANTPLTKVPTTMQYFRNVISRASRSLLL